MLTGCLPLIVSLLALTLWANLSCTLSQPQIEPIPPKAMGPSGPNLAFSAKQRQRILKKHNDLRKTVVPAALPASMKKMTWSNDLAVKAAAWAQCGEKWGALQPNVDYGQNIGHNSMSGGKMKVDTEINSVMDSWWKQRTRFNYNTGTCTPGQYGEGCYNYLQMAWGNSNKIGCGYALNCPNREYPMNFNMVCFYSPRGNVKDSKNKFEPYKKKP